MLKWILFDLNSFFASCEQQEDPSLRGKPVVVVPTMADSTSVIAASYEAKKYGIKTNTKVIDAKKMCPGLVLISGNHRLYTDYHYRILKACEEVLPIKKILSIDEMAFELIGTERDEQKALKIAQQMKDHVRATVGSEIKSSVGLGPNIMIAKIASDMMKPDGLVSIRKDQIFEKLGPLPVEVISGVGRQMKARLNAQGYMTVQHLLETPEHMLRKHWGSIWGLKLARELRGEDFASVQKPEAPQKSISHQHVLGPELRNVDAAYQVLLKLLMKALTRLRRERMKASTLYVSMKFLNGSRFENHVRFTETDNTRFFAEELKRLCQPLFVPNRRYPKPIKTYVVLGDLTDGPDQLSFFDNPKSVKMNEALDKVNDKFGANTLYLAGTQKAQSAARTRIAFHHIPDLRDEFDGDS